MESPCNFTTYPCQSVSQSDKYTDTQKRRLCLKASTQQSYYVHQFTQWLK